MQAASSCFISSLDHFPLFHAFGGGGKGAPYSTRLVPFITQRIANYAAKHPGDKPNDLYKVIKHFKQ